jgi:predicted Na+-dependent transporter
MNEFFNKYADLTALLLTLLLPLLLTAYVKRNFKTRVRAVPVYFLLFGPLGILSFIFFHLFENTYRAIAAAIDGHFAYNFHFYSLMLFGLVVAYVGALFLKACIDMCASDSHSKGSYWYKIVLILLITLPLIPITPIAAVPAIWSSFSMLSYPFVRKRKVGLTSTEDKPNLYYALEDTQTA